MVKVEGHLKLTYLSHAERFRCFGRCYLPFKVALCLTEKTLYTKTETIIDQ